MIFIIPLLFGVLGAAVGAVAGAFTAHAAGEKDRQAGKHHRQVANELTDKYANLEKKYYEFADQSKRQINDLTRQHALDEVEKDYVENIQKLPDKWEFCYFDLEKEVTYQFYITHDEIKNDSRKEINFLIVIESEFEELITIPEIKELIDSQRVAIFITMTTFEFLDTYQPFERYYQRLS
ncbi:MAG: hypothetical protein V7K77_12060 [Nostoc sp.]|uniref:hypothetical protein n=1 Tax=Nostoc sp. TaxID=1180 RepID=UPI002FF93587